MNHITALSMDGIKYDSAPAVTWLQVARVAGIYIGLQKERERERERIILRQHGQGVSIWRLSQRQHVAPSSRHAGHQASIFRPMYRQASSGSRSRVVIAELKSYNPTSKMSL